MKELKRYLDQRIGEYSFYFEDINSSYTYSFNERIKMPSADCIKIHIAIALLKKVQDNFIDLYENVLIKKEDMVSGDGIIHEFDEKEYKIIELLNAMLIQNDNTAANKIIDIIGMESINEVIKEMGLKDTVLKRKMMDFKSHEKGLENLTTSLDLANSLKLIYQGKYLNEEYSSIILNSLRKSQDRRKIPFYIPEKEWKCIGNKTGSLHGVENDAAILNTKKGDFIFVVMAKTLPNNVYGIVTISRLGKMMWDIIDKSWK
ncbi:beta-lactamase class A [Clostridium sp. USBA 49]|uniref:serine hydrolase n=1 Tax=Clostridium TaxID=1485 RepID=UPI000999CD9A|nr:MULTISPECIES: serine hydrolase [Clostridium]SKA83853.1 beta-lactamase class A [Clostridium sp. USBA 49]